MTELGSRLLETMPYALSRKHSLALCLAILSSCSAEEAPSVRVNVQAAGGPIAIVETDLGYRVTLTEARVALGDITFTIAGEIHSASTSSRILDWLVPAAYAHPGHYQGGEVTGELRGKLIVDFLAEAPTPIGVATMLVGAYTGSNVTLGHADTLEDGDTLQNKTALLAGRAERNGVTHEFEAVIDSPVGRQVTGVPCSVTVAEGAAMTLTLRFTPYDDLESDTLFDGIDFAALDSDGDGQVSIMSGESADAYDLLRRTFQTHDHFEFTP